MTYTMDKIGQLAKPRISVAGFYNDGFVWYDTKQTKQLFEPATKDVEGKTIREIKNSITLQVSDAWNANRKKFNSPKLRNKAIKTFEEFFDTLLNTYGNDKELRRFILYHKRKEMKSI